MEIAEIGGRFLKAIEVDYLLRETFLDYDMLMLDLDYIGSLDEADFNQYYVQDRVDDMREFVKHKKIPVIAFAPSAAHFTYHHNPKRIEYCRLLPDIKFDVAEQLGSRMEIIPNTLFTEFLAKYLDIFSYKSFLTNHNGKTIARTPHTHKSLGFFTHNLVVLPQLADEFKVDETAFLTDLYEVAKKVWQKPNQVQFPAWIKGYLLPQESDLQQQIEEKKSTILVLQEEIQKLELLLTEKEYKKILITGNGDILEHSVLQLFQEMSVQVRKGEQGRDDLIIEHDSKVAVVEIKGVTGSAAEKQAAQLEKWVANYHTEHEVHPKGILIVNAFREAELNARTQPAFPDQMLKYSKSREHCLITSTQLLGLYYNCLSEPERKDELINSLFETVGVYAGFQDWHQFITYTEESA